MRRPVRVRRSSIRSLASSPTTSPRRCLVRKPVPQATSSVRTGGRSRIDAFEQATARLPSRAARGRRTGPGRATSRRTRARAGRSTPSHLRRVRAVELPLESVPNFSEGRDAGTIEALSVRALRRTPTCSTFTPTRITTGRSSRWSATTRQLVDGAAGGSRLCAANGSTSAAHEGAHPANRRRRRRADRRARSERSRARAALRAAARGPDRRRARPARVPLRRVRAGARTGVLPARGSGGAPAPRRRGRASSRTTARASSTSVRAVSSSARAGR